jgi:hypothetical protein
MAKPERCPRCGSDRIVEIAYGLPTAEAGEAAERGEFILGGCMVGPGSPEWGCAACHWQPDYDESAEPQPAP